MAGFQAIYRGVFKQQQIAVAVIGSRRAWVTVFFYSICSDIFGKVIQQTHGQGGQVARCGGVSRFGQAFRVFVTGAVHPQHLGLLIHHLNEAFGRAAHALGQRHGGVIA